MDVGVHVEDEGEADLVVELDPLEGIVVEVEALELQRQHVRQLLEPEALDRVQLLVRRLAEVLARVGWVVGGGQIGRGHTDGRSEMRTWLSPSSFSGLRYDSSDSVTEFMGTSLPNSLMFSEMSRNFSGFFDS